MDLKTMKEIWCLGFSPRYMAWWTVAPLTWWIHEAPVITTSLCAIPCSPCTSSATFSQDLLGILMHICYRSLSWFGKAPECCKLEFPWQTQSCPCTSSAKNSPDLLGSLMHISLSWFGKAPECCKLEVPRQTQSRYGFGLFLFYFFYKYFWGFRVLLISEQS